MSNDLESPRGRKLRGQSDEGFGYGEQSTRSTTAWRCSACPCNFQAPEDDCLTMNGVTHPPMCPVCELRGKVGRA